MRKTLTAALLALMPLSTSVAAEEAPRLVTILTSDNPQTQLMSMVLTMQSLQQGSETYTLLCGPGGDLALKAAPEGATAAQAPKGMSPQGLMQAIMAKGGMVELCAIYLPNSEAGPEALLEGVGVAKPPAMAARLLAPNTRIMSF